MNAVDGGGMDDLVALFEEDDDINDSDIEMNSEDEFEKLLDDGGKEQHADKKPTKMETKSDQSGSFEAIKDENALLKEKLRQLEMQLAQKQDEKKTVIDKKQTREPNSSDCKSKYSEKAKETKKSDIETHLDNKSNSESATPLFKGKQRTAHVGKHIPAMSRNTIDNVNKLKRKSAEEPKEMKPKELKPKEARKMTDKVDNKPFATEEYSGIRIINPLISSQTMDSRMEGRNFIKMNSILKSVNKNQLNGDWVTVGVIVNKVPPKTASNGKTFSIWKLSDLEVGCENNTVTFFLFGDVYKDHWKTTEGTVVGLLNPSILPQRDNGDIGGIAITIDDPRKMMIMGISKDLGRCKGGTKSGKQCSLIVNKSRGDFCEHHITKEYKKLKSQRMEFQSGSGPDPKKGNLMKKFKKDVESGQYSYGGETLTWKDHNNGSSKPTNKKVTLEDIAGPSSAQYVKKAMEDAVSKGAKNVEENSDDQAGVSEEFKKRLQIPTTGSRNLLHILKKEEIQEKENLSTTKTESKSAKDLLNEEKKQQSKKTVKQVDIKIPAFKQKPPSNSYRQFSADFRPKLGRGFDPDDDIEFADFGDTVVSDGLSSGRRSEDFENTLLRNDSCRSSGKLGMKSDPTKSDIAKRKAIAIVRSKGIKFDKDEEKQKNKSPEALLQKINERVLQDISSEANLEPSKKRRKGILEDAFGSLDFDSKEGKKVLETKSKHVGLVRQAEAEREEAYFNALEKKEMYEDKMQNVMEKKVQVVCCKICKYMHEYASSHCKNQGHPTVRVEAVKRFFFCKGCKHRVVAYKRLPDHPCKNCGANNYERTSMFQEAKGPKIGAETLLVRGEEQSRFLNALK